MLFFVFQTCFSSVPQGSCLLCDLAVNVSTQNDKKQPERTPVSYYTGSKCHCLNNEAENHPSNMPLRWAENGKGECQNHWKEFIQICRQRGGRLGRVMKRNYAKVGEHEWITVDDASGLTICLHPAWQHIFARRTQRANKWWPVQ